jgi:Fe-S-cluster containining protein
MAVKVEMERPTTNMCLGCPGHCCKLVVDLTSYDMFRLALLEGKAMDSFAQLVLAEDDDAFAFKCLGKMVKFILKHKKDGFCVLLDDGASLKCTVEGSKPAICLAYPFSLRDGKPLLRDDALCPPVNRLLSGRLKMSVPVLEDAGWEWARYQEFVDDWNLKAKGDEKPEDFLRFAAKETELEKTPLGRIRRGISRRLLWLRKGR